MGEKLDFPTKLEKKLSIFDQIRKFMKRTSIAVDKKGRISYISYPPRGGFSKKQAENIETLEVKDALIVGDDRDRSLHDLKNLKTLVLGNGVVAVTEGAIPSTTVEELVLSDQARQIPIGAIADTKIKKVRCTDFTVATISGHSKTDIFFDQDERLNFIEHDHNSLGQLDDMAQKQQNPVLKTEAKIRALSWDILRESSKQKNEKSIYVYSEALGRDRNYSVPAIVDTVPMPASRSEKIDDDKLIGIFVTGKEEVDLSAFTQYPNLTQIVVGKDVLRVIGAPDLAENGVVDQDKTPQRTQKNINGKSQLVTIMSGNTVVLKPMQVATPELTHQPEKTVQKEDREME